MKKLIFTLLLVSSGSMLALIGGQGGIYDCSQNNGYLEGLKAASRMTAAQLADTIEAKSNELRVNCPPPPPATAPMPMPYKR